MTSTLPCNPDAEPVAFHHMTTVIGRDAEFDNVEVHRCDTCGTLIRVSDDGTVLPTELQVL